MITWYSKQFGELTPLELYAILQLRTEVFVVEQNCVFQDMDGKDNYCHHIMGWNNNKLIATARIVPPGISYEFPSIGRVVISPSARGQNAGKELMNQSILVLTSLYGNSNIRIGAQLYLKKFYESFGFEQNGAIYDEDGIDHILMTRYASDVNLL
jgi:ElaA protein